MGEKEFLKEKKKRMASEARAYLAWQVEKKQQREVESRHRSLRYDHAVNKQNQKSMDELEIAAKVERERMRKLAAI